MWFVCTHGEREVHKVYISGGIGFGMRAWIKEGILVIKPYQTKVSTITSFIADQILHPSAQKPKRQTIVRLLGPNMPTPDSFVLLPKLTTIPQGNVVHRGSSKQPSCVSL